MYILHLSLWLSYKSVFVLYIFLAEQNGTLYNKQSIDSKTRVLKKKQKTRAGHLSISK